MKVFNYIFIFFALLISPILAEDKIVPKEVKNEIQDPIVEGKQWNRWTTKNFVICSINNNQAQYLSNNLEDLKTWIYTRWGFSDMNFNSECSLICVDNIKLYEKFFRIKESKVEIRRKKDSKNIELSVVFLLLNKSPSQTIPAPITEVCISEFEQKNKLVFGWWAHRGISLLNENIPGIREKLKTVHTDLSQGKPMYFTKSLLNFSESQWKALSKDDKDFFDRNAMMFCLFLRKEFGQYKFLWFLKDSSLNNDPELAIKKHYGFFSYDHIDVSLKRYMSDLTGDIKNNKTPDSYLQIKPVAKKK